VQWSIPAIFCNTSIIVRIYLRAAFKHKIVSEIKRGTFYDFPYHQANPGGGNKSEKRKIDLVWVKNIRSKKDYCWERNVFWKFAQAQEKATTTSNNRVIPIVKSQRKINIIENESRPTGQRNDRFSEL